MNVDITDLSRVEGFYVYMGNYGDVNELGVIHMSGGLYGHRYIEDERLKEWINTWCAEDYTLFLKTIM